VPGYWGRPPRREFWQDIQALALWVLIIGVAVYLLFPSFFKDVYTRLIQPAAETGTLADVTLPQSDVNGGANAALGTDPASLTLPNFPNVYNSLYNGNSEVSTGYWAIFVAQGEFKQLAVSGEAYAFLLKLIQSDSKAEVKNTLFLVSNGQIRKYVVSDEVYNIVINLAAIDTRSRTGT